MSQATDLMTEIKNRIENSIPNTQAEVFSASDRHYSLTVISQCFADLPQVKQHQLVYAAIADLMKGDSAPIHAIDKMDLRVS